MKRATPILAAALAVGAAPAFAGNTSAPVDDTIVAAPQPAPAPTNNFGPNWTGAYGGVQLGYGDVDTNVSGNDDGVIGGLTAGYDYDLGNFVVGGGLDYDFADIGVANNAATLENVFRAKVRGGYKLGDGLLYATGGYAQADTDNLGSDDGYFIGGGYEHMITQNFSMGGELLYHEFDDYNNTAVDVEATTLQVRGTYRF
ncbi:outer membrane beta-barrel protein [Roseovarius sp. SK2]|uniref:outer membrane protein n=1 Tax=Roseovarius TaxID=74030 RepID=UPI00237BAE61|nr:outer membrane beta-barrel protein [Roseovarius sp. SK2]MDD9726361.1 outer membrane beta-barrel protein [Roseovarius sp. SK2]